MSVNNIIKYSNDIGPISSKYLTHIPIFSLIMNRKAPHRRRYSFNIPIIICVHNVASAPTHFAYQNFRIIPNWRSLTISIWIAWTAAEHSKFKTNFSVNCCGCHLRWHVLCIMIIALRNEFALYYRIEKEGTAARRTHEIASSKLWKHLWERTRQQ